jgi:hypothetical protein
MSPILRSFFGLGEAVGHLGWLAVFRKSPVLQEDR